MSQARERPARSAGEPRVFGVEQLVLDLPALAVAFAARLEQAGVATGVERSVRFAHALALVRPVSRRRLYWTARSIYVCDRAQVPAFDAAFAAVFGAGEAAVRPDEPPLARASEAVPVPPEERPSAERTQRAPAPKPQRGAGEERSSSAGRSEPEDRPESELPVPVLASAEELLRTRRFDALEPPELADLYRLMEQLRLSTPVRRSRRSRRDRHGARIDMRRTLRRSMRTCGDPLRLARRSRRVLPRRIVLLCDISGSMEPYGRAYLQFLTSAAGSGIRNGGRVEAFVFATRLTRLTRALGTRSPERAIQRAAALAPDWSSGTRIGEALRRFNDRHGRRGMARGAVIVILSDGWERGSPALVGREMQRLSRLAHRIIWVNPRAAARGFVPKAGGMAAALPYCDALVSGESLDALAQVAHAIGCEAGELPGTDWPGLGSGRLGLGAARAVAAAALADDARDEDEEPWGSATPVPGSSVAMPSGWGPSRGHTTPGWGQR